MVGDLWFGVASGLLDYRDKAVVLVGGVLHDTGGAIRFLEAVRPLHEVAVPGFPLILHVATVRVVHGVLKLILGVRLEQTRASH